MFEIRPAALSEFALLPAIEAEADTAFESLDPPMATADFPPPGTAADFAAAFHIMVAGRPPAGFVRLEIVDGQAHLEQLAVTPGLCPAGDRPGPGHGCQGLGPGGRLPLHDPVHFCRRALQRALLRQLRLH